MTSDDRVLSAVLRGDQTRWPCRDDREAEGFLAHLARHGIQPLIARQTRRGILHDVPPAVQQSLDRSAVQNTAVEPRRSSEVRRVIDALARAGVPSLVMKGTALAHTHYPHPCLRPRTDTDLLVRKGDLPAAAGVFAAMGYEALNATRGDFVLHQLSYCRTEPIGIRHVLDVHWKVASPRSVSDVLRWDELAETAMPVAALGDHARTPTGVHALLIACVHRMTHHYDNRRLIWLYDIHLLAAGLGEESWRVFVRLIAQKRVAALCVHSLALARERFATRLPDALQEHHRGRSGDATVPFDNDVRLIDILASDLRALPGWRQRLGLLREHLFPPAEYIRHRYGASSPLTLPVLYAHRVVTGVAKWLRPALETDPFAS